MVAAKSLARRRLRPSHATQRSNPAAPVHGKPRLTGRFADDLDGNAGCFGDAVAGIGEDALDEGQAPARCLRQRYGSIAILDRGGVNLHAEQAAVGIHMAWRLRPITFLPASRPRRPPASVVLTFWLSITAADGCASRPARSRSRTTR
jgi:hypothetical protein